MRGPYFAAYIKRVYFGNYSTYVDEICRICTNEYALYDVEV